MQLLLFYINIHNLQHFLLIIFLQKSLIINRSTIYNLHKFIINNQILMGSKQTKIVELQPLAFMVQKRNLFNIKIKDKNFCKSKMIKDGKKIDDQGMEALLNNMKEQIPQIDELDMGLNKLTGDGINHFIRYNWSNIKYLSLYKNSIGTKGCKILARVNLQKIKTLSLGSNEIESEGLIHLSKSQWNNLQVIHLIENRLSDCLGYLIRGNWKSLKQINLGWNKLSLYQIQKLLLSEYAQITFIRVNQQKGETLQNFNLFLRIYAQRKREEERIRNLKLKYKSARMDI